MNQHRLEHWIFSYLDVNPGSDVWQIAEFVFDKSDSDGEITEEEVRRVSNALIDMHNRGIVYAYSVWSNVDDVGVDLEDEEACVRVDREISEDPVSKLEGIRKLLSEFQSDQTMTHVDLVESINRIIKVN